MATVALGRNSDFRQALNRFLKPFAIVKDNVRIPPSNYQAPQLSRCQPNQDDKGIQRIALGVLYI